MLKLNHALEGVKRNLEQFLDSPDSKMGTMINDPQKFPEECKESKGIEASQNKDFLIPRMEEIQTGTKINASGRLLVKEEKFIWTTLKLKEKWLFG